MEHDLPILTVLISWGNLGEMFVLMLLVAVVMCNTAKCKYVNHENRRGKHNFLLEKRHYSLLRSINFMNIYAIKRICGISTISS
jgi:hypothetical protein